MSEEYQMKNIIQSEEPDPEQENDPNRIYNNKVSFEANRTRSELVFRFLIFVIAF